MNEGLNLLRYSAALLVALVVGLPAGMLRVAWIVSGPNQAPAAAVLPSQAAAPVVWRPVGATPPVPRTPLLTPRQVEDAFASLQTAMASEVAGLQKPARTVARDAALRAVAMLARTGRVIDRPQLVVVVDRNPLAQRLFLMLARPGGPDAWRAVGVARVSTGQAGRRDHYFTPIGVFGHTDAILDFRAAGTFNEHHVRGLGAAGMRVWDFGWQWALKGWHTDGEGGDIRLQMHATDPDLLERRLGRPASEGCVRISSSLNRFFDRHGVLDADYERVAVQDIRYSALLGPGRAPTPLAGRLLIVIDSQLPGDPPPTSASRPPNWPGPAAATRSYGLPMSGALVAGLAPNVQGR